MRLYFKARVNRKRYKGNIYLNYDTDKKLYAMGEIPGVDYERVRATDMREILDDLRLRHYKAGLSLDDDPDDIPFS